MKLGKDPGCSNNSSEYAQAEPHSNATSSLQPHGQRLPWQNNLLLNIFDHKWSVVKTILGSQELIDEVRVQNIIEPTPLHVVCSIPSTPLEIIMSILHVYGKSCCLVEDDDENLPIHIACATTQTASFEVIRMLLGAYPETSKLK
eukprot:CAMPEP_0203639400 /NCGR_PEP_ID=MMETSP0088-20131115/5163_1 /ASSEMBLY_ACC=CAM_ASM_001087 /TAXON_ID=426623 /ORGANISM="Chaetoceros affinis, Strain CCMP159" /LENGTH=144 /DNA_ID=CAMNT_0050494273 /DNA_START=110 /DNA_END=547 /DNA_ORIENTATION=-